MGGEMVAASGRATPATGSQRPPSGVEGTPTVREPQQLDHLRGRIGPRVGSSPDTFNDFRYRLRYSPYTANAYAEYRRPPRYQVPRDVSLPLKGDGIDPIRYLTLRTYLTSRRGGR